MKMPYGATQRTAYRRGQRAARASAARKKSVSKARGAVKRIQRKAPRVTQVTKNRQSVVALSKSVYKIERSLLGARQENRSHWQFDNSNPQTSGEYFDQNRPFCFCAEWFHLANTPYSVTGGASGSLYHARAMPEFNDASDYMFNATNNIYDQWKNAYDDIVSTEQYLPLYLKMQFEFNCSLNVSDEDIWIRIDVVKQRKVLRKGLAPHQYSITLPDGIPSFSKLATSDMMSRNAINPTFYKKVQKTRWCLLKNRDSPATARNIRKLMTVNMKFPNKVIKPDIEPGQSFLFNLPPDELSWIVVSTSANTFKPIKMEIMRHTVWRDQHGTTM